MVIEKTKVDSPLKNNLSLRKMKTKYALTAIAVVLCFVLSTAVSATVPAGNQYGNATSSAAAGNGNMSRLEALQKQYERLAAMIAELKAKLGQGSASVVADQAQLDCARAAVSARESAIATAQDAFGNCTATALSARKAALESAWNIAESRERNKATNDAWNKFTQDQKTCQENHKKTVKAAWDEFKSAIKNCKIANGEGNREGIDLSLGN